MPNYKIEEGTPQYDFFKSRAKLQVFGGGYGNGKTTASVVSKALKLARDYPGCNGLMARATYPKLKDTLQKVFFEWCPPHWIKRRPTQDDNTCYLTNGSVINFRYIAQRGRQSETGETTSNLLSATYDWIIVDQAEDPEIVQKDIMDLMGRLRGDTPYRPEDGEDDETMPDSGPRWLILTLNPTRNWIYRELIQPYHLWKTRGVYSPKLIVDEESRMPIMDLIEGSTYTNARNLKPDYIRGLESMYKGQMKDRYLLGKWAAYEGLVYDTFEAEKNLITRDFAESYMQDCLDRDVRVQVIEMYDFGLTSPSCYLLAFVDDYGRVIILDGYHKGGFPYNEQPQAIMEIRAKYPFDYSDSAIIADPAIFRKHVVSGMPTGESVRNLLTSGNSLRFRAGTNDMISGIAKVAAYVTGHEDFPHLVTGATPGPLLYIVDDLTFIEDEFGAYYWKKNPQGMKLDEPAESSDHALDCIKYGLSFRPMPSEIVIPKHKLPPAWLQWHEVEERM